MPRKPLNPCSYPGCPNLTDGQYCDKHRVTERRKYDRYQRDPEIVRRYHGAWRAIRERYIRSHPLCEDCFESGRLTPAAEVHHVLRCPVVGRTMKKTSAHFAVPVTTRDTSHSVTDDGTVGLCHADPQGEVKSLRPFPLENGEGSREQKSEFKRKKSKKSIERMKQSWQKTVRAGAEHVPVLAESRKLSPKKWQPAIPAAES